MAYTEQTANSPSYGVNIPSASIWDNGSSRWDLSGNVYGAVWDEAKKSYTEETSNTTIWVKQ